MILFLTFSCSSAGVSNACANTYINYETQTQLKLPFDDEWFVFLKGRGVAENYRAIHRVQRFALDFVQKKNGRTHSGNGLKNEDYYCFGKLINAPDDGIIVEVIDDIHDNVPGQFNRSIPTGNLVVIDHENGEFSLLAHLKKDTIIVGVGDVVVKGQALGKTGNSGNSSEPHLHYHLQNTVDPFNGEGLPAKFQNYYVNNVLIERGEPMQNEYVNNDN